MKTKTVVSKTWRMAEEDPEQFLKILQVLMKNAGENDVITITKAKGICFDTVIPEAPKDTYCKTCNQWKTAEDHAHNVIDDMCDDCFSAGIHYGRMDGAGLIPRLGSPFGGFQ